MPQITMRDLSTAIAETRSHLVRCANLLYPAALDIHRSLQTAAMLMRSPVVETLVLSMLCATL